MKRLGLYLVLVAFGARAAELPPPQPSTEYARPNWRTVQLHLLSDDQRLELRDSTGRTICRTPCDRDIQFLKGDIFKLDGEGLWGSDSFSFAPQDSDVTLRVRAGTRGPRTAGYAVLGLGGGVTGLSLVWLAFAASAPAGPEPGLHPPRSSGPYIGLGVGLAIMALGGLIIFNTGATRFSRE
jgi:hypothetical protein